MKLRTRISKLVIAAVIATAPSLAIAALDCTSCCCPPKPCHGTPDGCEMMLTEAPCCGQAPLAVPSVAKRALEAPTVHATIPARSVPVADILRTRPPERGGDLERLVSPLRLSVVLLI